MPVPGQPVCGAACVHETLFGHSSSEYTAVQGRCTAEGVMPVVVVNRSSGSRNTLEKATSSAPAECLLRFPLSMASNRRWPLASCCRVPLGHAYQAAAAHCLIVVV